jgi:HSP20 family protein
MLTRWNPFDELTDLHREVDRLFGRTRAEGPIQTPRAWLPATDVTSSKEGWQLRIALPGIEPEHVSVDLHGNTLTVKGERSETKQDQELHVSEIRYGRFERTFALPAKIESEKVTASFQNGMLELQLPLAEAAKPRRIEIGGGAKGIDVKKVA